MISRLDKIYIDFQGGAHGNYLEFVCNRFLAQIPVASPTPFSDLGSAHGKQYLGEKKFIARHFTELGIALHKAIVISIHIEADDLLPLQCISLLRAGDFNIHPDRLEIDTYHKLNNEHYRQVLDNILDSFFSPDYFIRAYETIADASWPKVKSLAEYRTLPTRIQQECEHQHGFKWLELNADQPHCPRHVLREFFELGFKQPKQAGFLVAQDKCIHTECVVHRFPFSAFYDSDRFMQELSMIGQLTNSKFDFADHGFQELHQEFLEKQPYKDAKTRCDELIRLKRIDPDLVLPDLDVIQEAYIASQLS